MVQQIILALNQIRILSVEFATQPFFKQVNSPPMPDFFGAKWIPEQTRPANINGSVRLTPAAGTFSLDSVRTLHSLSCLTLQGFTPDIDQGAQVAINNGLFVRHQDNADKQRSWSRLARKKHHQKQLRDGKRRLDCYVEPDTKDGLAALKAAQGLANEGEVVDYLVKVVSALR